MMHRRTLFFSLLAIIAVGGIIRAAGTLRIVPTVRDDVVIVSAELADGYTDEVREAIASGLRTTFVYDVELRMAVPAWVDRTIASATVSISDNYDSLTRLHNLSRLVDGRVEEALVTGDEAVVRQWLMTLKRITLCRTSKLDAAREYYVRITARVRPPGASLLGWTNAVTSQAKFTFIP
jgi:Domain of unknown function (DUF4390)